MKKFLFFLLVFTLLSSLVTATTTLTNPEDGDELTINSIEELTATCDLGTPFTCTFYDKQRGDSAFSSFGSALENETNLNVTIPNAFGTYTLNVTCTNTTHTESDATTESIKYKKYDAGETSEISIDLLMGVLVAIVGFASLIGLILLFNWIRKKL